MRKDEGKNIISTTLIQSVVNSPYSSLKYRSERIVELNPKSTKININVETWADVDKVTYMCWGDYWVKQNLKKSFTELGLNCEVHPNDADVTVYLWGSNFPTRKIWPFGYN